MLINKGLKLYIWEEVLCNYGCGIAFTLAHSANEARRLIRKELTIDGWTKYRGDTYLKDFEKKPRIIIEPEVFYMQGDNG